MVPEPVIVTLEPAEMVLAMLVAWITPVPLGTIEAPVVTVIVAVELIPVVRLVKARVPLAPHSVPAPEITPEEFTCKHCIDPVTGVVMVPVNVGDAVGAAPRVL